MSAGLDTSVVLRLLTGSPTQQAGTAHAVVAAEQTAVAVSDLGVGEASFALRPQYAVPQPVTFDGEFASLREQDFSKNGQPRRSR